jgi:hypothetical protein
MPVRAHSNSSVRNDASMRLAPASPSFSAASIKERARANAVCSALVTKKLQRAHALTVSPAHDKGTSKPCSSTTDSSSGNTRPAQPCKGANSHDLSNAAIPNQLLSSKFIVSSAASRLCFSASARRALDCRKCCCICRLLFVTSFSGAFC